MLPLSTGELIMSGPLLVAGAVAAVAGAVSFFSPCCLPLVPGYLSYVAGVSGAELTGEPPAGPRREAVAGLLGGATGGTAGCGHRSCHGCRCGGGRWPARSCSWPASPPCSPRTGCCSVRWGPGCSPIKTWWSGFWGS